MSEDRETLVKAVEKALVLDEAFAEPRTYSERIRAQAEAAVDAVLAAQEDNQ